MLELIFFFFNDTATTEIYTLSLHDALPISAARSGRRRDGDGQLLRRPRGNAAARTRLSRRGGHGRPPQGRRPERQAIDRKSTRLNSSHANISYAVFCLKKKKRCKFFNKTL